LAPPAPVPEKDRLLLPPPPGLDRDSLWSGDGNGHNYHFSADVGFEMLWTRWGNPHPALGPDASLGVFNEKAFGVSTSWFQADQSTSKTMFFTPARRP
jgi:hypothetical protein